MQLHGKTALITGGSRGIGKAIALRLAAEGCDIVVNYFRKRPPAEETAAEIEALGRRALLVKADIGDSESLEGLFAEVEREFGGLDILVNNAATGYNRPIMEQRQKGWDWTLNVNARAALFGSQLAVPLMQKCGGGHIINMSSLGSQFVMENYVMVGTSKAALESITRYQAVEFAPMNISVNAISAGPVMTDALQHFPHMADELGAYFEAARAKIPAGRNVTPDDLAGMVVMLCSPEAAMLRGQVLVVDGGLSLRLD